MDSSDEDKLEEESVSDCDYEDDQLNDDSGDDDDDNDTNHDNDDYEDDYEYEPDGGGGDDDDEDASHDDDYEDNYEYERDGGGDDDDEDVNHDDDYEDNYEYEPDNDDDDKDTSHDDDYEDDYNYEPDGDDDDDKDVSHDDNYEDDNESEVDNDEDIPLVNNEDVLGYDYGMDDEDDDDDDDDDDEHDYMNTEDEDGYSQHFNKDEEEDYGNESLMQGSVGYFRKRIMIQEGDCSLSCCTSSLTAIPNAMFEVKEITHLKLDNNRIRNVPAKIESLLNLKELNLLGNVLTDLPTAMARLVHLKKLNLWANKFRRVPDCVPDLKQLLELDVGCNQLSDLPTTMKQLLHLKKLNLKYNKFTRLPDCIPNVEQLVDLNLENNQLHDLPADMKQLVHLKMLNLGYNKFSTVPDCIPSLEQLLELNMHGNLELSDLPTGMTQLVHLKKLDLWENRFSKIPDCIPHLEQLEELDMSQNKLSEIPVLMRRLVRLKKLDLGNNLLKTIPVEMTELAHLEEFKLIGNTMVQPPLEVCQQDVRTIFTYLCDLKKSKAGVNVGSTQFLIQGRTMGGKTSFARSLFEGKPVLMGDEDRTKVWEQYVWEAQPNLVVRIGDFGGHECHKVTHPFFYSPKAINGIVFSLEEYCRDAFHDLIGEWLETCLVYNQAAAVLLIGTHADLVNTGTIEDQKKDIEKKIIEFQQTHRLHANAMLKRIQQQMKKAKEDKCKDLISHLEKKLVEHKKRYEDHQLKIHEKIFVISSKTMEGFEELRQELLVIANQSRIILPETWFKYINALLMPTLKEKHRLYLTWDRVLEIYKDVYEEDIVDPEAPRPLIQYLHDTGQALYFASIPELSHLIFHCSHRVVDIMKSLFDDDLHVTLCYDDSFHDKFTKRSFIELKKSFLNCGIMNSSFLFCWWKGLGLEYSEMLDVVVLLKKFHLCCCLTERVSEEILLFPWFLQTKKPPEINSNWPLSLESNETQLAFQIRFAYGLPWNFFHRAQVALHKHVDSVAGFFKPWQVGVLTFCDGIKTLMKRFDQDDEYVVQVSVRGTNIPKMWTTLLHIHQQLVRLLQHEWPGVLYNDWVVCGHCLMTRQKEPFLFTGEILCCHSKQRNPYCEVAKELIPAELAYPHEMSESRDQAVEFGKQRNDPSYISFLQCLSGATESVGIIRSSVINGSGFRVGTCYLMTNYHVIKGIIGVENGLRPTPADIAKLYQPDVDVIFTFNKPLGCNLEPHLFDHVEPLAWYDSSLDIAVIKLAVPPSGSHPVSPLTMFQYVHPRCKDVWIMGHPGGQAKQFEKCDAVSNDKLQDILQWADREGKSNQYTGADDKQFLSYYTSFEHGASGSPCFVIGPDESAAVAAIHTRGFPKISARKGLPVDKTIEQGIKITAVCHKMRLENPELCFNIFGQYMTSLAICS